MLDLTQIKSRYFPVKLQKADGKTIVISVKPPKTKTLKAITGLKNIGDNVDFDDVIDAVLSVLNNNKSGYKVPREIIEDMDIDTMIYLLTEIMAWVNNERKEKN